MPGSVQSKNRPAVVLSSASYHATRPDVIVALVTSNTAAAIDPSDHVIADWQAAGLKKPSAARAWLFTMDTSTCRPIGRLSPCDWQALITAVAAALDLKA